MSETENVANAPGQRGGRWARILAGCGFYGALLAAYSGRGGRIWQPRWTLALPHRFRDPHLGRLGRDGRGRDRPWRINCVTPDPTIRSAGLALFGVVVGMISFYRPVLLASHGPCRPADSRHQHRP